MNKLFVIAIVIVVILVAGYMLQPKYSLTKVSYGSPAQLSDGSAKDVTSVISKYLDQSTGFINVPSAWTSIAGIGDPAINIRKTAYISYKKKFTPMSYTYANADDGLQSPFKLP